MKTLSKRLSFLSAVVAGSLLSACGGVKVVTLDETRVPASREADCALDIFVKEAPRGLTRCTGSSSTSRP
jgi:hypothetical protein